MEKVIHLNCSLLQKQLEQLTAKNNFRKKTTIDVWKGPKEYKLLLCWILHQILLPPLNLKIWCRIPAHSLITIDLTLQLSYREYRYIKQALENYRFCRNSGTEADADGKRGKGGVEGWKGHLVCVTMTHCVRKWICDSPLSTSFSFG